MLPSFVTFLVSSLHRYQMQCEVQRNLYTVLAEIFWQNCAFKSVTVWMPLLSFSVWIFAIPSIIATENIYWHSNYLYI